VCREALASDAMLFTRASCQAAFDASNTTLTLLGLDRQLPRCAFCSIADALEAARHNPLAFLHLANPRTLCLVLQHHGPFGQLAQLGAIMHEGMRDVAALLAARQLAGNARRAVPVERRADELLVRVETLPCASWRGTRRAPSLSSAVPTSSWCASRRCRCPRTWRARWSTCSIARCRTSFETFTQTFESLRIKRFQKLTWVFFKISCWEKNAMLT
jgi:hypothetical protein